MSNFRDKTFRYLLYIYYINVFVGNWDVKFNKLITFFLQDHDGNVARTTSTTTSTRVLSGSGASSSSRTRTSSAAPEVLWRQDSERRGGGGGEGRLGQRGRKSHSVKVRERRGGIAEIRDKTLDTD